MGGAALVSERGDAILFFFLSVEAPPRGNGSYLGKYLIPFNSIKVYVGRNLRTGSVCKLRPVCRLGETLAQFAHRVSVCKSNDVIAQ